jgi:RNA polymerase sigma factor (sigma-70 family)
MEHAAETESFDDAFDRLFRIAYRSAYRLLGSREDAEDVAIDALTRASLHWRKVHTDPAPWVTTVSANLAIDIWRRRKRSPTHQPVPSIDPLDSRRIDLVRALERLPRRQRNTVVLRYFADLTESQTAQALGVSTGSVKQHTSRAMVTLKRELGEP